MIAAFALASACSSAAYAQNTGLTTVADYYYLLPDEFFPKPDFDKFQRMTVREYRESAIQINDSKNGYMRIQEPVRDGWAEVAIFKQSAGKYVVGISENDCAPGCTGKITFRQYVSGSDLGWYNMTNTVMPKITAARIRAALKRHGIRDASTQLVYVLPRTGTTIKVQNAGDYFDTGFKPTVLFELVWTGSRFDLKDK